ncbi:MAG TPA: multicopper oxidase domain-containing protein [Candidatus Saccharimonadales bacterium]|nr:multicopper oxidase domain-containing protein [Candidatus Saccharimonadales bacterium]
MKILKNIFIVLGILFVIFIGVIFYVANPRNSFVNQTIDFGNPLFIPKELQPRIENGEKVFDVTIQKGQTEFFSGKRAATLGFNNNYLGDTLRAHTGDKIRINVKNTLGEETTVHWHGMHVPAAMDGGPHQVIEPNTTWQPYWTIKNQASTLWYHPHLMGKTGEQVYKGLAGLFIIDNTTSDALNLPKQYGIDDIPLIVQDRLFDSRGQLLYNHQHKQSIDSGMLGDTILVNGTVAPYINVPAKLVRLRIVNASNARRYNFGFSDSRVFYQIATDGGFLTAPVRRTKMILSPGERAEVLVDFSADQHPVTLMSLPVVDDINPIQKAIFNILVKPSDQHQQFNILEIRPQQGHYTNQTIPQKLTNISFLKASTAVKTRQITLDSQKINDKKMDLSRVDEIIKKGDTEIWSVKNKSPIYHPFHMHDIQFQILDRNGVKPAAYEQGWKDTVMIEPSETVRLIMQFNDYADPTLPYMFHCHLLEHEDMGMMAQFVVVDTLSEKIKLQSPPKSGNHEMQMQ